MSAESLVFDATIALRLNSRFAPHVVFVRKSANVGYVVGSTLSEVSSTADKVAEDRFHDVEAARARIAADEVARLHRARAVDDHRDGNSLALYLGDGVACGADSCVGDPVPAISGRGLLLLVLIMLALLARQVGSTRTRPGL